MRNEKRGMRSLALLLAITLTLGVFAFFPQTVKAESTDQLVASINGYNSGGLGSLTAEITGENEVTISGSVREAKRSLILDIDQDVTVIWRAELHSYSRIYDFVQLSGNGDFIIDGGTISIENNDWDNFVNSVGTAVYANLSSKVKITVNSGTVHGTRRAILSYADIIINGGTVNSYIYSNIVDPSSASDLFYSVQTGENVTVNGGTVSSINASGDITVNSGTVSSVRASGGITVNGGTISYIKTFSNITGYDGTQTIVSVPGNVIINGGILSSVDTFGTVIMNGGEVINTTKTAINGDTVIINGGTVRADTGAAIYSPGEDSRVSISGGVVFAYGKEIICRETAGIEIYPYISAPVIRHDVIHISSRFASIMINTSGGNTGDEGNGVVVAWDSFGRNSASYEYGSSDDLRFEPAGAKVHWGRSGENSGIMYSYGENNGFIPINGVTVTGGDDVTETPDEISISNPFVDIYDGAWFYDAVMYVYGEGLMVGISEDKFGPDTALTRAMIVTILYRNAEEPDVYAVTNPFSDVEDNQWYTNAIKWAADNDVVNGYGDGRFGPGDNVTNEQLAVLIYRTQQVTGKFPPHILMDYEHPDWDEISEWAKSAVNVLTMQGVFRDLPGIGFYPQTPATRAAVASILYRYLTAIN